MAQIARLIAAESTAGDGTALDPVRIVYELWTLDGEQVARYDPYRDDGRWDGRVGPQGVDAP